VEPLTGGNSFQEMFYRKSLNSGASLSSFPAKLRYLVLKYLALSIRILELRKIPPMDGDKVVAFENQDHKN